MTDVQSSVPNAVQRVYEELRALIMKGHLRPRERITELQMAERVAVSRTPVREAISRLVMERLIVEEGRSLVVADVDLNSIREIYEMRIALEGYGVAKATANLSGADLDKLEPMVYDMERLAMEKDFRRLSEVTSAFHWALLEPCGNQRLLAECKSLIEHCQRFRAVTHFFSMRQHELVPDHRLLLDVVRSGDSAAVEAEVRSHLLRASDFVR